MKVRILIRLRKEILDPEGKAVAGAVQRSGFPLPESCRVGKMIELDLPGDKVAVEKEVRAICDRVLVNGVMQEYELQWL